MGGFGKFSSINLRVANVCNGSRVCTTYIGRIGVCCECIYVSMLEVNGYFGKNRSIIVAPIVWNILCLYKVYKV